MRTDPKRVAVTLALIALPLAACGGDDDGGGGDDGGSNGGSVPAGTVHVIADDGLTFDSDEYSADAGEVSFLYEGGNIQHSLVVEGYEDEMRLLIQGDTDEGSLSLDAGEYTIYCDISGHQAGGMEATLTVG
jgi:cytochrome c oxidase subunit 2